MSTPRKPRPSEYRARLLKLADYLDTLPPETFDYDRWGYKKPGCGTVACALGHAVLGPFKRHGYTLEPRGYTNPDGKEVLEFHEGQEYVAPWEVGEDLFGEDAWPLFSPDSLREARASAKQVATKIRNYVARKEAK